MSKLIRFSIVRLGAAVLFLNLLGIGVGSVLLAHAANTTYYVDCSAASNGNGTQASPWNNFAPVNATTFTSGDSILLKRGTTCVGQQLWPKGSGTSGNPITLGAYGTGNRPIIDGNNAVGGATQDDGVVKLWDQQYWVIQDLEIKNSLQSGLLISGSGAATLNYFRILNVYSHNHGTTDDDWCLPGWGGGNDNEKPAYPTCLSTKVHEWEVAVNVNSMGQNQKWNDVVIDGVTTDTAFRGIEFYGPGWNSASSRSTNLTIRNSSASNVQNDGIFVGSVTTALVENNIGFETGVQPYKENHTPNSIWNFGSGSVVFQFNEAYQNHSPDVDGGAFDADYSSNNTTYQYNYGHDNDGYCVSAFGAGGFGADPNTNIHIRYNICSNNGRDGTKPFQGDLYVTAWSAGKISNAFFYNNTLYWNPVAPNSPEYTEGFWAIRVFDIWHGGAITNLNFYNNIVYSASPDLVSIVDYEGATNLNNNLYWYTGAGSPRFDWGGATQYPASHVIDTVGDTVYLGLAAFKAGTGEDANSIYADPLLNSPTYHGIGKPTTQFTLQAGSPAINAAANLVALGLVSSVGTRDFFGNTISQGGVYDIGAAEFSGGGPTATPSPTPTRTNTPPPTNTPTAGPSPTPTRTNTATNTPTATPTRTNTPTPTNTPVSGTGPAFVKTVGTAACGTASNVITVPAAGVAAGNTLVVRVTVRAGTPGTGAASVSDSKGNTYVLDKDITNGNIRLIILSANITTALVSGNTITVTYPPVNPSAAGFVVTEFSGIVATNRVDVSASAIGSSTTPSVSATTTNANDLLYGVFGTVNSATITEAAGWTLDTNLSTGCGGATGASLNHGAYRIVSTTGMYTYNPTLSSSLTWADVIVAYRGQ